MIDVTWQPTLLEASADRPCSFDRVARTTLSGGAWLDEIPSFVDDANGLFRFATFIANLRQRHESLQQRARDGVMRRFRDGSIKVLVATDVVGRGIDVTGISHIINYDIPQFCDDYVHRVGRTGRMGRSGVAYTFVSPEQGNELTRIEMRIDRLLQRDEMPGFAQGAKPEGQPDDQPEEPKPAAKPVFGRTSRRVRRAL